MLHNLKSISPVNATYIANCYICPARLFIECGAELLSKGDTIQGGSTSMGAFAHWILPLLQFLLDFISVDEFNAKEAPYVDDFTVVGKLSSIKD